MNNQIDTSKYVTISVINRYLKKVFENNTHLQNVYLKGEISNFKAHTRGHWYFTLKDETSRINAIMFSFNASKIKFKPIDGMKVLITGKISVYEASGSYQVYVTDMIEDGVGNLHIAFEQLKEKLNKEGLFNSDHKKKIPKIPKKIGIVTAPTGAAIKDILSTIKRRFPLCETILFPALVQGGGAAPSIVKQIKKAQEYDIDTLIVGRGGGSIEDLWAFNEEIVAREIYACKIPVISAVGHEIDFTISDFVADLRAPTPTGAAEMAVPNMYDMLTYLEQVKIRIRTAFNKRLEYLKLILNKYINSYILKNPMSMYEVKEQNLDNLVEKLNNSILNKINVYNNNLSSLLNNYTLNNPKTFYEKKYISLSQLIKNINYNIKNVLNDNKLKLSKYDTVSINKTINHIINEGKSEFSSYLSKLEVLNPMSALKRGYGIVKKDKKCISNIKDIEINDNITIQINNGIIESKVVNIKVEKEVI